MNPWESVRYLTVDQLVTRTKLAGSSMGLSGFTTPEGYPFVVVVAVASPGNERAVECAQEFHDKMAAAASFTDVVTRETDPP